QNQPHNPQNARISFRNAMFRTNLMRIRRIYSAKGAFTLSIDHYCDPPHQHQVVREYFKHLDETLPRWRPHPFHPTFYAAYWHLMVTLNALKARGVQIRDRWRAWFRRQHRGNRPTPKA
ncbi:MAG: hypothetical protein WBK37_10205, partial [Kiritimatiellia bacterium]